MPNPDGKSGVTPAAEAGATPGLLELFLACSRIGLSGFGGVLPLLRHMLVEQRRLLDGPEFNAHQIDFDEMLQRLRAYKNEEDQARKK